MLSIDTWWTNTTICWPMSTCICQQCSTTTSVLTWQCRTGITWTMHSNRSSIDRDNLRRLQVGPVKPVWHMHSAIVGPVCRQVPPFWHVFAEQTETTKQLFHLYHIRFNILLLHSHRGPAKPVGHKHWIRVVFWSHIPLFKQTFLLHVNPKSIKENSLPLYCYCSAYILNNHNVQNPANTDTWNYSVVPVEHNDLDSNKVVFDKYSCTDIDRPSNNPGINIDN